MLFHDTNVKERHFGVFRLWEELRQLYPCFEFIHGHGLGVLGIGKSISPGLRALYDAANNDEQVAHIRSMYSRLGSALTDRYHLANQTVHMTQKDKLEQAESSLLAVYEEKGKMKVDLEIKHQEIQQLKNQLSVMEATLKEKAASIAYLDRTVTEILSSKSWRWCLPLRKLRRIFSL